MAAQLIRKGEDTQPAFGTDEYDAWLLNRIKTIAAFPDSDFTKLMMQFDEAASKLDHLFMYQFDDNGIVVMPKNGGAGLPPARFPVRNCLSVVALAMAGKYDGFSSQS